MSVFQIKAHLSTSLGTNWRWLGFGSYFSIGRRSGGSGCSVIGGPDNKSRSSNSVGLYREHQHGTPRKCWWVCVGCNNIKWQHKTSSCWCHAAASHDFFSISLFLSFGNLKSFNKDKTRLNYERLWVSEVCWFLVVYFWRRIISSSETIVSIVSSTWVVPLVQPYLIPLDNVVTTRSFYFTISKIINSTQFLKKKKT